MDETNMHPARDQQGLAFQDGLKQRQSGPLGVAGLGEVTINDVVGKTFDGFQVAARGEILEGSDADVAGCDTGQHGSAQLAVAINRFAGRDSRERPSGRNSERMHRFADEIFAQDRPQRGAAVSAPRKRRPARALQLDVAPLAATVQDLAEEDREAIAIGSAPGGVTLPANTAASSSGSRPCALTPSSEASDSLNLIRRGFVAGVGASRAKKRSGSRA